MGTFRVVARLRGNVSWRFISETDNKIMQDFPLNIEKISQYNVMNPTSKMMSARIPEGTKFVYTGEVSIYKVQAVQAVRCYCS